MAHFQTPRPAPQAKMKPLTEQEKQARIMQFLAQKRETFSVNILCSLLQNNGDVVEEVIVDKAVSMADALMEKLYPMPKEEKPKEETPVQTDFD